MLERLVATRVVADPAALDEARWPDSAIVLRTAPDEALVLGLVDADAVSDPHAIVRPETGMVGVWRTAATRILDAPTNTKGASMRTCVSSACLI